MNNPASSGLKVEAYYWGDVYRGSREALIAAGIVGDGAFPGDPGRGKYSVTIAAPCGKIRICRVSRARFEVHVPVDEQESEARVAREQRANEARRVLSYRQIASNANHARRALHGMAAGSLAAHLRTLQHSNELIGFRFEEETLTAYASALHEALDILRAGRVIKDRAALDAELTRLRHEVAQADAGFQRMLAGSLRVSDA